MISSLFVNKIKFTLVFIVFLLSDIFVKIYSNNLSYRFVSKPFILFSLIAFYYYNTRCNGRKVEKNVLLALLFFLLGDFAILNSMNNFFLFLSILFFAIGKVFFCLKFKNKEDFEYSRLFPFSLGIYIFVTFIISVIYKNLQSFFIPAMLTLFISLVMLNLAYLRKGQFSKWSYICVLMGCLLFVFVEGVNAISTFNKVLLFPYFLIMISYGVSVYLIVLGITLEGNKEAFLDNKT
tara:strand:- start:62393 stop:63100 length:708 start_codon:yes stop_codon:yes gene_type:complete